ncbi:LysR family transcriptional regulator [Actibacterium sp. 188UL27-1]|uniref:LysR family transcriptional regulator n=1 Tax=Actibacterium sp. 188UL27-1 TaxID=2786961 RepID=UPI001958F44E|nr:LysR family transcriptional regulator [Actibacterium sp. 188UL27-1]MBM7069873.1 LysR family transcriptional regulator [Actibacterium sp. 188UL27-1]
MDNWNEIRTAAYVARLGTISAASTALGVHRATVTRHVDALEALLGARLFQRHARGFTPTELGQELLRIADATDIQFGELHRIARGTADDVSGTVTVTSLDVLVPFVLPMLARVQAEHPALTVDLVSSDRVLKLEYGEAALAFRIGRKPDHPDNVVIKAGTIEIGLYAAPAYAEVFGLPESADDYAAHRFVGPDDETPRTPYFEWLKEALPLDAMTFRSNNVASSFEAVKAGLGIGFLPKHVAKATGCQVICDPVSDWHEDVWAVTHVDLHRSSKVQALLSGIRQKT